MSPAAKAALTRMTIEAGQQLRQERLQRGWTLRTVAVRAGVAVATVHATENGEPAGLESYARVATALGLRPELTVASERARADPHRGTADFVHAAMGEFEARALARPGRHIGIDEPYQHYQFAGRADVVAWDGRDLLHIENRTQFPNVQEAAGGYNAKRQYLARAIAERVNLGPNGWRSVTHVMACLRSAEVLHVLRLRRATFAALGPDEPGQLEAWLAGEAPRPGTTSTVILLDPTVPFGSRRRALAPLSAAETVGRRYRDYAAAAAALRATG
jgi:transcriptional regulator with XRE-family HTH domain